jgi:AcrR family transcriptional regulator
METGAEPTRRARGRPAGGSAGLSAEHISRTALRLLEQSRGAMSVRQLAAQLGVDAMAIYHYFPSKAAVVDAAVSHAFSRLDRVDRDMARASDEGARLEVLAAAYLRCIRPLPMLTRLVALGMTSPAGVAGRFDRLFSLATGLEPTADARAALARDVLVDFLHGYALAGRALADTSLGPAIRLLAAAMHAAPAEPSAVDCVPSAPAAAGADAGHRTRKRK